MYEKILVPLDGSKLSEVALPYAEELAGRLDSEVILIHVRELPEGHYRMREFYLDDMVKATRQGAEKYCDKSGKRRVIRVKSDILSGNPAEKIVDYADKGDVGLIVMSTHGRSGIKRWTLGSVADKVVRATKQPVALIRAKGARSDVREKGILNKVLVPLDGSKEGEVVIPYVEELASKLNAKVILLQVLTSGYATLYSYIPISEQQMEIDKAQAISFLDKVGARLKQKGITVTTEMPLVTDMRFANAAEEIIKFADEMHVDMVAMSTHGRSGVGRWVFGSVAERVLYEGNTPLLLVREPRASEGNR